MTKLSQGIGSLSPRHAILFINRYDLKTETSRMTKKRGHIFLRLERLDSSFAAPIAPCGEASDVANARVATFFGAQNFHVHNS